MTVSRPRWRWPPGAALVRVGFGTSRRLTGARSATPAGRAVVSRTVGLRVRARGNRLFAEPAARLVLGAAANLLLGLLARLLLGLAALGFGALAGEPGLLLGAAARLRFRLLALFRLAHPRFLQRVLASVALGLGQRAQHHAAGARARLRLRGAWARPPALQA